MGAPLLRYWREPAHLGPLGVTATGDLMARVLEYRCEQINGGPTVRTLVATGSLALALPAGET